jgi:hypothetical protein
MIVIATDKMYIVAKKIFSVFVDEDREYVRRAKNPMFSYNIRITFEPDNSAAYMGSVTSSRNEEIMTVEFKIHGYARANTAYRDIVNQIREQCPDQVYLDKMAEKFLTRSTEDDDPCAAEVRQAGKTKGRSKEVLRRTKTSFRRVSKRSRR